MASTNNYAKGTVVRVTGTYTTTASGAAVDPTDVYFSFISPGSTTVTTYHYGVDSQLVKSSTGIYTVDLSAAASGTYFYRHYATGTAASATESSFDVGPSRF